VTEQAQLTEEQVREINRSIPVVLRMNVDEVNALISSLAQLPFHTASHWIQMLHQQVGPQVQAWEAQQAAKAAEPQAPAGNEAA
jgi:hypothetical protein